MVKKIDKHISHKQKRAAKTKQRKKSQKSVSGLLSKNLHEANERLKRAEENGLTSESLENLTAYLEAIGQESKADAKDYDKNAPRAYITGKSDDEKRQERTTPERLEELAASQRSAIDVAISACIASRSSETFKDDLKNLFLLKMPPGTGKTHMTVERIAYNLQPGQVANFVVPDTAMADQVQASFEALDFALNIERNSGRKNGGCLIPDVAEAYESSNGHARGDPCFMPGKEGEPDQFCPHYHECPVPRQMMRLKRATKADCDRRDLPYEECHVDPELPTVVISVAAYLSHTNLKKLEKEAQFTVIDETFLTQLLDAHKVSLETLNDIGAVPMSEGKHPEDPIGAGLSVFDLQALRNEYAHKLTNAIRNLPKSPGHGEFMRLVTFEFLKGTDHEVRRLDDITDDHHAFAAGYMGVGADLPPDDWGWHGGVTLRFFQMVQLLGSLTDSAAFVRPGMSAERIRDALGKYVPAGWWDEMKLYAILKDFYADCFNRAYGDPETEADGSGTLKRPDLQHFIARFETDKRALKRIQRRKMRRKNTSKQDDEDEELGAQHLHFGSFREMPYASQNLILLDASAREDLIETMLGHTHEKPVVFEDHLPLNAHLFFLPRKLSKSVLELDESSEHPEAQAADVEAAHAWVARFLDAVLTLLTHQKVSESRRRKLTIIAQKVLSEAIQEGFYPGAGQTVKKGEILDDLKRKNDLIGDIMWYGAQRGIDSAKDTSILAILGKLELPSTALRSYADALYAYGRGHETLPRHMVRDHQHDEAPFEKFIDHEMVDGRTASINTPVYADPMMAMLHEQTRDEEIIQAIGRARSVRETTQDPNEMPIIFVASNVFPSFKGGEITGVLNGEAFARLADVMRASQETGAFCAARLRREEIWGDSEDPSLYSKHLKQLGFSRDKCPEEFRIFNVRCQGRTGAPLTVYVRHDVLDPIACAEEEGMMHFGYENEVIAKPKDEAAQRLVEEKTIPTTPLEQNKDARAEVCKRTTHPFASVIGKSYEQQRQRIIAREMKEAEEAREEARRRKTPIPAEKIEKHRDGTVRVIGHDQSVADGFRDETYTPDMIVAAQDAIGALKQERLRSLMSMKGRHFVEKDRAIDFLFSADRYFYHDASISLTRIKECREKVRDNLLGTS